MAEAYDIAYRCKDYLKHESTVPKALEKLCSLEVDQHLLLATHLFTSVQKIEAHPKHGKVAQFLMRKWGKVLSPANVKSERRKRKSDTFLDSLDQAEKRKSISNGQAIHIDEVVSPLPGLPTPPPTPLPSPHHQSISHSIIDVSPTAKASPFSSPSTLSPPSNRSISSSPKQHNSSLSLFEVSRTAIAKLHGVTSTSADVAFAMLRPVLSKFSTDELFRIELEFPFLSQYMWPIWKKLARNQFGIHCERYGNETWKEAYRRLELQADLRLEDDLLDDMIETYNLDIVSPSPKKKSTRDKIIEFLGEMRESIQA